MITRRLGVAAFVLSAASCSPDRPQWVAPARPCPGALRPVWMADPRYTICVETSFRTRDLRTWRREQPGRPADRLTVQAGVNQTQIDLTGGWPPRLNSVRERDRSGAAFDSVATRTDTVNGMVVHTEIGRRLIGAGTGSQSVLSFVAGFQGPEGQYVIGSGESASAAVLDTLLLMVRSVARSPVSDPNPRR